MRLATTSGFSPELRLEGLSQEAGGNVGVVDVAKRNKNLGFETKNYVMETRAEMSRKTSVIT